MTTLENSRQEPQDRANAKPLGPIYTTSVALAAAEAELASMKSVFSASRAVASIDPARVCESRWVATPHDEWTSTAFVRLKEDIMSCGYNVQPIKVRPADGQNAFKALAHDDDLAGRFEIVFGHRRHRACLELGLPVHCVVESMSDKQLIAEFVAENRGQSTLLSWRLADTLDRSLSQGLFPSARQLAHAIAESLTNVALLLKMARLPADIRSRFSNVSMPPSCVKSLAAAYEQDPGGVHHRANSQDFSHCRHPRQVVQKLNGARTGPCEVK